MPVTFVCSCGKTLQVKDDLAGRQVRCPACNGVMTVPAAQPAFEVVEDLPPAPALAKPAPARPVPAKAARAAEPEFEVVDDEPAPPPKKRVLAREDDDDEDDRPRGRRRRDEDEEDDRPRKRRRDEDDEDDDDRPRKKRKVKAAAKPSHFGFEKKILNGGVAGGLLAMVGAVVWFVLGLMADRIFFYPPILFIIGLIAVIKGLMGGGSGEEDEDE